MSLNSHSHALHSPFAAQWLEMDNQYKALAERQQWLDAEFAHIPALNSVQQMEMIMAEFRSLVTRLTTGADLEPKMLARANNLARTCLASSMAQRRDALQKRRMNLNEQQLTECFRDHRRQCLKWSLKEAKSFPDVNAQIKEAFALVGNAMWKRAASKAKSTSTSTKTKTRTQP